MDEHETPNVSLVSCMHFVRRGVAKAVPEKIEITEKELETIIKQTKSDLRISNEDDEESGEDGGVAGGEEVVPDNPDDEFNFDKYDEDEGNPIGIGSVATVPNLGDLPDSVNIRTEGPDSDEEDDYIKPDDNLLLIGHVESDASVLEVYIYNKAEGSFYVHHDIVLPWFPLCIEWLSHDPSDAQPGNLCALGGMDPVIQVWDLDIENCLEPVFKLGKKPNKKKKQKRVGHKDAVLDLSWNKNFSHVLASGSADSTVMLWDLDQGEPHTTLTYFGDKVQSISFHLQEAQTLVSGSCDGAARVSDCRSGDAVRAWQGEGEVERVVQSISFHPQEAQTLVSGSCDGAARVSDCRSGDAVRAWQGEGEVERVVWDTHHPFCFAMSNNEGKVSYVDVRQNDPLWSIQAHEREVTGLILCEQNSRLMITVGTDGKLKTWDRSVENATQVSEKSLRVGQAMCAAACPDAHTTLAVGGDNKQKYIELVDLSLTPEVTSHFNLHSEAELE